MCRGASAGGCPVRVPNSMTGLVSRRSSTVHCSAPTMRSCGRLLQPRTGCRLRWVRGWEGSGAGVGRVRCGQVRGGGQQVQVRVGEGMGGAGVGRRGAGRGRVWVRGQEVQVWAGEGRWGSRRRCRQVRGGGGAGEGRWGGAGASMWIPVVCDGCGRLGTGDRVTAWTGIRPHHCLACVTLGSGLGSWDLSQELTLGPGRHGPPTCPPATGSWV